jgi:hypothetical protein
VFTPSLAYFLMFIIQYSPLTIHCGRVQALNLHLHLHRY